MSRITCEQENQILDQLNGRQLSHKIQTSSEISDMSRNVKKLINTPKSHGLKTTTDTKTSSRKAFGNVSNVFGMRSGTQQTIEAKHPIKMKAPTKESNVKSAQKTCCAPQEETDAKYLDDIEEMHPMEEQLMSDLMDPITHDLFAIDEHLVLNMGFDSDMTESLVPNKQIFDLDFL